LGPSWMVTMAHRLRARAEPLVREKIRDFLFPFTERGESAWVMVGGAADGKAMAAVMKAIPMDDPLFGKDVNQE
jgi:hypothetical protein